MKNVYIIINNINININVIVNERISMNKQLSEKYKEEMIEIDEKHRVFLIL